LILGLDKEEWLVPVVKLGTKSNHLDANAVQ